MKTNNKNSINRAIGLVAIISFLLFSCSDFVDIDPPVTEISGDVVYTDEASAKAAMMGVYSELIGRLFGIANGGPTLYGGLSSDEFLNFSSNLNNLEFFENALTPSNGNINSLWSEAYTRIFAINSVIEGLKKSSNIGVDIRTQLMGEAVFMRAFLHFYLVNLFGDVPYITTTDFRVNTGISRMPEAQVYEHIISDLTEAKGLLLDGFSFSNGERTKPNRVVATAMLARVYLYTKNWNKAEAEATDVINNSAVYAIEDDLNTVFLPNSAETIWQLVPQASGNTAEGLNFILTGAPRFAALTPNLLGAFESGDERLNNWVGHYSDGIQTYAFPFKYKVQTSTATEEYYTVLRMAEQYLIRSEARTHQGDLEGAKSDLNVIRNRAGLEHTTAMDEASLLLAIEQERRIELFAEWGQRWLDLKRIGRADAVLAPIKTDWQLTDVLYPIPLDQILRDSNMDQSDQNPGY